MKAFAAVLCICGLVVVVFPAVRITVVDVNTGISHEVANDGNDQFASLQPEINEQNILDLTANTPGAIPIGVNDVNAALAGTRISQGRTK